MACHYCKQKILIIPEMSIFLYNIIDTMNNKKTIYESTKQDIVVQRSKFIGYLFPINSIDEFKLKLNEIKKKYYDATHVCYAYVLNETQYRYDDDNEPFNSAGKPMLNWLINNNLTNIAIIVIRYFGNKLLGVGNLSRAYTNTLKKCLENTKLINYKNWKNVKIAINYSKLKQFKYLMNQADFIIEKIDYLDDKIVCFCKYDNDDVLNSIKQKLM